MTNKLDSIVEELKQNTLTVDAIEDKEYTKEDLFEIKIGSVIIGPFTEEFLKSYAEEKNLIDYNILIKTMESILWVPLYQHPNFFSSDSEIEPVPEIKKKNFYLLVNGRKVGPYRIEDIDFKVKNNEVLFTDQISEDSGASWKKLYELEGFDLRRHEEGELPVAPGETFLDEPVGKSEKGERFDAVGDLAKIGHQSTHEKRKIYSSEVQPRDKSLWKSLANIGIFVVIIFVTIFVFDKIDPFGPEQKVVVKKVSKKEVAPAVLKKAPRPSPSTTKMLEEKKERRKRAISKRKKVTRPRKTEAVSEEYPYPEDDNYADEEPEDYFDDRPKPKKKKKVVKKKKAKKSDDDYYEEDTEEEDPY